MNRLTIAACAAALLFAGAAQARPDHRGGHDRGFNHGSQRAQEVHRMLARGENPGHHYGQMKSGHRKGGDRIRDRRPHNMDGHRQLRRHQR